MADSDGKYILYHYYPSLPAAIIFAVLFLCTTLLHVFQLLRRRTLYFIPFVIGGCFEVIGYVARAVSSTQSPNWTTPPYIVQSLLLLLAPALFAASIYMVLGRIILLTDGEAYSLIRARWLTKLFVTGDVLSFLAQSAGGGMLAKATDDDGVKLGEHVIIGGLIIQILFFGVFILVAGIFHVRIARHPTARSQTLSTPWQRHLGVLYAASALVMARSVFRVAEYLAGADGVLLGNELYLYILDASLMFVAMLLFNVWHPSAVLAGRRRKEELEVEPGVGGEEYRPSLRRG